MSITKGSMLISNANAVGAELVNQLGGTGYKPVEWADAINLLGISNDDKASALAGITEGTYTGDERGSIKYSNCNAVGSMLNKKFSTDRGFKPVEWESAISKLTPLAEGTGSGSVASIENGADDVPTKSLVVTISPTLTGFSEVSATQSERNFYPIQIGDDRFVNNGSATHSDDNGTLVIVSSTGSASGVYINTSDILCEVRNVLKWCYDRDISRTISFDVVASVDNVSLRVTSGSNTLFTVGTTPTRVSHVSTSNNFSLYTVNTPATLHIRNFQIELGSIAHDYEPYVAPTTYTANLGRTIYGGTADIVNGGGQELVKKITVSSFSGSWGAVTNGYAYYISNADTTHSTSVVNPIMMQANQLFTYGSVGRNSAPTWQYGGNDGGTTVHTFILPSEYDTLTKANNFLASLQTPLEVTLTLATPTDFTFTGQEVPTRLGYNAFWSDEGDTEVTYRKDPDIPDPPVQLLNMNNENNENNDN